MNRPQADEPLHIDEEKPRGTSGFAGIAAQ